MSRSGYSEDYGDDWLVNLYRGRVARSIIGNRGQKALMDFIHALDSMPEKKLVKDSFHKGCGVCSLGALASHRGVDVSDLEPFVDEEDGYVCEVDSAEVGRRLDISKSMANEVMYENDEHVYNETEEARWSRMRRWAIRHLSDKNKSFFEQKR